MSQRKRWMTESWPGAYERRHSSMRKAYEYVSFEREARRTHLTRSETIVVKVNEGAGWKTYERIRFPAPEEDWRATSRPVFQSGEPREHR